MKMSYTNFPLWERMLNRWIDKHVAIITNTVPPKIEVTKEPPTPEEKVEEKVDKLLVDIK